MSRVDPIESQRSGLAQPPTFGFRNLRTVPTPQPQTVRNGWTVGLRFLLRGALRVLAPTKPPNGYGVGVLSFDPRAIKDMANHTNGLTRISSSDGIASDLTRQALAVWLEWDGRLSRSGPVLVRRFDSE